MAPEVGASKIFTNKESMQNTKQFVVFQTSKFQTTPYVNHVSLGSKPELTFLKKKDQPAGLLSLFIQMYVVHLGQGHLEEKNTSYY